MLYQAIIIYEIIINKSDIVLILHNLCVCRVWVGEQSVLEQKLFDKIGVLLLQDVPLSIIVPSDNRYSTILKSSYSSSFDFEDLRIWCSGIISLFYCMLVQVLILKS